MKNYKILVLKYIILISLLFIISGVLNYFFYSSKVTTEWVANSFVKKDAYAMSINKPKIVFSGGSNVLFGIETHYIEKFFNIPTVNFGLNAGLKTDYLIYRTKQILNNGDIVILPLEYENFTWSGSQSKMRINHILTHDKTFFNEQMSIKDQLLMLYSIKPYDLLKSKLVKNDKNKEYDSKTLNKNGDETKKNFLKESLKKTIITPFKITDFYESKGLIEIKKFNKWCKKNNINLYLTFPNTVKLSEYNNIKYKEYFANLLNYFKTNDIKIIGKPLDFMFPLDFFYDSTYHLNEVGSKIRTEQFIKMMLPIINLKMKEK